MVSSYQRSSGAQGVAQPSPVRPAPVAAAASAAGSSRSTNGQSSSASQGSNRLCAQCRNHGLRVPVRGHKRYCTYRLCSCRECRLVRERQRIVALHLYVRRAQEQEEEAAAAAARDVSGRSSPALQETQPAPQESPVTESSSSLLLPSRPTDVASADTRERMLYESLLELRQSFPVPNDGVPLLLCILKSSRSVHEASAKIVQGTRDLTTSGLLGLDGLSRPSLYM